MGKGSGRRPTLVPEEQVEENWRRMGMGPKKREPYVPPPLPGEEPEQPKE